MDLILSGTAAHERALQNSLKDAMLHKLESYSISRVEYGKLFKDINEESTMVRQKKIKPDICLI
jgi:DNA replication licensing factor MCM4